MKKLGLFVLILVSAPLLSVADESLDVRAAKECKKMALAHALAAEKKSWGSEVWIEHIDRSISMGVVNGSKGEVSGDSNVEVTLGRESTDPIVYEMRITATPKKNLRELNCKVVKTVTRDLL